MPKNIERLYSKFKDKYLNQRLVFLGDLFLSLLSSFLVLASVDLLLRDHISSFMLGAFAPVWMLASLLGSLVMMLFLKTSHIIIRHTTLRDFLRFLALALGKALLMLLVVACAGYVSVTTSLMLLLDLLLTLFLLLALRVVMIMAYEWYKARLKSHIRKKRALIYGLSDKSTAVVARLNSSTHYEVVGFICEDMDLSGTYVSDQKVYSFCSEETFAAVAAEVSLSAVIFSTDDDVRAQRDNLVAYCTRSEVVPMVVPELDELQDGALRLRDVKIEDLLGREEIKISTGVIASEVSGKTVMVTGAAGSIGSELCRQLASFGVARLILYDNAETPMHNIRLELEEKFPQLSFVPVIGDVRLEPRLDFAFRCYKPQAVFHAAAYKHVPLMEENPCEAVLVNVIGSRQVADKCLQYGVEKMVMVSTDKAVNPTNIMGCSKRLAEMYVQSLGLAVESGQVQGSTKFVTTRFGNVLGSSGSVVPRFREQIAKGGPVTVTHPDINRFFMTIPEACRLVLEAATMPVENRICVFNMGEPVKIDALARRMIELSGLKPDVDIKIEYTGLRPGEKLYEEVLSSDENTDPTSHDRIRIARVRSVEYESMEEAVKRLEALSREVNIPVMVQLMKELVPEFISNNSRFSVYDKK